MWILVSLLLLAAIRPVVVVSQRGRSPGFVACSNVGWLVCGATVGVCSALYDRAIVPAPAPMDRPIEVPDGGYVGSGQCRACHPREHTSWSASFHSSMTRPPSAESIAAPWNGQVLEANGERYELRQRGDVFTVEMTAPGSPTGPDTPRVEREVVLVTGSHHAQVFWFSAGLGRNLAMFAFAYRMDLARWVPFDDIFLTPPGYRQPTEEGARWNTNCFKCHATHGRPRKIGPGTNDTYVSQMGIACEACHGPGGEHVAANLDPVRRARWHTSREPDPTIVNPARLSPQRASQVCGQCHSPNHPIQPPDPADREADFLHITSHGFRFRPGDDLLATAVLDTEGGTRFWPDGMIRVTGREYSSLRRTACHTAGTLSCLSCHLMHPATDDPRSLEEWRDDQLRPEMRGDAACHECHRAEAEAGSAHSHHASGSPGAACMNCHMPHTTYGLLKAIRSHEITSPSATSSMRTGRPNACNLCHLDRTLAWTSDRLAEWYGHAQPELSAKQTQVAAGISWLLTGDAGQRALAAWSMAWPPARDVAGTDWQPAVLAQLLDDPYHPVRYLASRALAQHPEFSDLPYDSLGDELQLRAAKRAFLEEVRKHEQGLRLPARPELLRDRHGRLRSDEIRRLARTRDDRPIYLAE